MVPSTRSVILARLEARPREERRPCPLGRCSCSTLAPVADTGLRTTSAVRSPANNMPAIPCGERTWHAHPPVLVGGVAHLILPAPAAARLDTTAVINRADLMLRDEQAGALRRWKS